MKDVSLISRENTLEEYRGTHQNSPVGQLSEVKSVPTEETELW